MQTASPARTRLRVIVRGAVQGVGFRPFVLRLASELGLAGWVNNSPQGVRIEAEGERAILEQFLLRLDAEKPPRSSIQSLEASWLDPAGLSPFEIRESTGDGDRTALVLPDIATCADCVRELFDPANRRHLYPFINCTHCGPRFSIIEALPYDRANTAMKTFAMCPRCQAEYEDPNDRRFHAQPNACPDCGPQLELWQRPRRAGVNVDGTARDPRGRQRGRAALRAAAAAIRAGGIVALKGLGGFQLLVAANQDAAVRTLRERKQREEKPFALMFPTLAAVKAVCEVSPAEERLLRSPEAPIVLLRRLRQFEPSAFRLQPSPNVAPGNPCLGVMLPYTPLHHLLLAELGVPVVATSGNLSDEPICIDEYEAVERLGAIADSFLVHNRPIVRHVDDSVVRVMLDRELVLRRARGYAPLPVEMQKAEGRRQNVLAVGAHLKNTIALSIGSQVFLSQHIGDLETGPAYAAFRRVIADFQKLYETAPEIVAADTHPDYLSTRFAQEMGWNSSAARDSGESWDTATITAAQVNAGSRAPGPRAPRLISVQHHVAHVLSCMAENEIEPPALGIAWDGTGLGYDGGIWGGEFFRVETTDCSRVAHFRRFRLPGGDQAVREPRRAALGLLHELLGDAAFALTDCPAVAAFPASELAALQTMLARGLNSPLTSSAGRLFDVVAALLDLRQRNRFEGQAAMDLEFALEGIETGEAYAMPLADNSRATEGSADSKDAIAPEPPIAIDWAPMMEAILADARSGIAAGVISAKFHNALVEMIVAVARRIGERRVVLTGGCFQNRYLTERSVRRLREEGFLPYWHQRVPPNDGGIALGQIVAASRGKG